MILTYHSYSRSRALNWRLLITTWMLLLFLCSFLFQRVEHPLPEAPTQGQVMASEAQSGDSTEEINAPVSGEVSRYRTNLVRYE